MRVLILGGAGMLGHKLVQVFAGEFDTWTTLRGRLAAYAPYRLIDRERVIAGVDALDFDSLAAVIERIEPQAVINCIGIIKQLPTASDPVLNLTINSLLPHRLQRLCQARGARLIHFSTDCVFSGRKGRYTEDDPSDALDLYGRTKFLGETAGQGAVTIRSSVIGRELTTTSGLVEWFLSQRGRVVQGYTRAIYSGFTTTDDGADRALDPSRSPRACRHAAGILGADHQVRAAGSPRARPSASRLISCPTKRCRWIARSTPRGSGR